MSKLHEEISVSVRFQRSTRIDHDLDQKGAFFHGLVFHGTAEHTLNTIADNYAQARRRAFTVTGPYGSGKSTIALLLAGLLAQNKSLRTIAKNVIGSNFDRSFKKRVKVDKGWCVVKVVCDFEEPIQALWRAIKTEAEVCNLDISKVEQPTDSRSFIRAYKKFAELTVADFDGVVILMDEMGKTLDYLNSQHKDLQFYQELAETIERFKVPSLFIGFMHQAFAEYSKSQNQRERDNWAKVQGRYTDLLFNVSEDETVTLLGACLQQSKAYEVPLNVVEQSLAAISASPIHSKVNIREKLSRCLPLHPLTAMLLGPVSKRRFSQNERSTFSFLSSAESKGFQEFIKSNELNALFHLCNLYDYLEANLDHLIAASPDARVWNEAKDAVERTVTKHKGRTVELVKTIAMLNLFARKLGIFATKDVLHSSVGQTAGSIDDDLALLEKDKVIVFREHLQSYAVFEGSDVDISEELEATLADFSGDEWHETLAVYKEHVVAKRHYHQTGALRWMNVAVQPGCFDPEQFKRKQKFNANAFSSFVLVTRDNAQKLSEQNPDFVFGTSCGVLEQIKELILEQQALEHIAKHNEHIKYDRIAKKELENRQGLLQIQLDSHFSRLFNDASWYSEGKQIAKGSLSEIASQRADTVFHCGIPLLNELINRTRPSATVVAARNKLMTAMVSNYFEKDLGITGYPAEMAMYHSCLKHLDLHKDISEDGEHSFVSPNPEQSPKLAKLWADSLELIKQNQQRIVSLDELVQLWGQAPYGVTSGLIPIWLLAFLLSTQDNLAFYDQDVTNKFIYITEPDDEFINKLVREPAKVAVRYFEIDGLKQSQINALHRILTNSATANTTLTVAQEFVRFVSRLSPFVKNTKNLSKEATRFRELTLNANDPNKYILDDLPTMFGKEPEAMLNHLGQVVEELKGFLEQELKLFKKDIDEVMGLFTPELLETANSVHGYSTESGLKTFALRISEFTSLDSTQWVKNMLSFLSGTAERNWTDASFTKAKNKLVHYAERFKQASYFAAHLGLEVKEYESKDHGQELQQIDSVLEGLSIAEQAVVLRKKLERLLGES